MTKKSEKSAPVDESTPEYDNSGNRRKLQALHRKFSIEVWPEVMNKLSMVGDAGISEFDLLKYIQKAHCIAGIVINFSNPHALFPIHFLLFHHLYQWQEQLITSDAKKALSISPLAIKFVSKQAGNQVGERDTLSAYYTNIENLYSTSNDELDAMLSEFWKKFCVFDEMGEAFNTLGLAPTQDLRIIKKQYQKQMAEHHPDRGGCSKRAQDINRAYHTIKKAIH